MNVQKQTMTRFAIRLGAALILIVGGLLLGFREMSLSSEMFQSSQDSQLMKIAQSVDNDIIGTFRWYCSDLTYSTSRPRFLTAEEEWRASGDTESLLSMLSENPLPDKYIDAMAAYIGDEIFLSSSGRTDYRLGETVNQMDDGITVRLCRNGSGAMSIALCMDKSDIGYAALIDLESFFSTTEYQSTAPDDDHILLLTRTGSYFICRYDGTIHIGPVTDPAMPTLGLSQLQSAATEDTFSFDAVDEDGPFTARLAVLPAASNDNGSFTIGVLSNYYESAQNLRSSILLMCGFFALVAVGVVLLILSLVESWRRSQLSEGELALMREKTATAERLNQELTELNHHQRLETIGTLTASISHEFNNLLTPIMGYSMMTLEGLPPDGDLYDNVLEIYNASQRAKAIVTRLSELSRKNTPLTFSYAAPDELVERNMAVTNAVRPPHVEVETSLNCKDQWLWCNEVRISQLLLNLTVNAFQAMEETGGKLTISTFAENGMICFRFADTGPGIPDDVLPHIFEPFFTTKGTGRGSGLGLVIVQEVVENNQGSVQVETELGKGTVFTVAFPSREKR